MPILEALLAAADPTRRIPAREYPSGEEVTRHNIHRHEEAFRRLKDEFQANGVTELHVFV